MANTFRGVGVNFGVSTTTITGTAIGTFKLQGIDHTKKASDDVVKDGDGATVQITFYDPMQEATFEYVISGADNAAAITATTMPAIGILVTVADANDATIAATNWVVMDVSKKRGNTGAARVTLKLNAWPGVTT